METDVQHLRDKQYLVTNRLAILACYTALFWIVLELALAQKIYAVDVTAFFCFLAAVALNRGGFRLTARLMLVATANTALLLNCLTSHKAFGGSFIFFPLIIVPTILFKPKEKIWLWTSIVFPVASFVICELAGRDFFGHNPAKIYSHENWVWWANVATSFFLSLMIVVQYRSVSFQMESKIKQESEKKLKSVVNSNLAGIAVSDKDAVVVEANDAFLNMLGYCREDVVQKRLNFRDLTPPEFLPLTLDRLIEAGNSGSSKPFEKQYIHKDGRRIPVLVNLSRLGDSADEYIGVILDMTPTKLVEIQAAMLKKRDAAIEAREELCAIASHELNAPLTILNLKLNRLKRLFQLGFNEATALEYVADCEKFTKRMAQLIRDLFDVSKLKNEKMELKRSTFDLVQTANEIINDLELNGTKNSTLISLKANGPAIGEWDQSRIGQVIHNMISNAVKYGEGNPVDIEILNDVEKGYVRVEVTDRGPGIPKTLRDLIFEKYERASADQKGLPGLGLGLYVAREIIRSHGGEIWVEDHNEPGAKFIFEVPVTGTQHVVQKVS